MLGHYLLGRSSLGRHILRSIFIPQSFYVLHNWRNILLSSLKVSVTDYTMLSWYRNKKNIPRLWPGSIWPNVPNPCLSGSGSRTLDAKEEYYGMHVRLPKDSACWTGKCQQKRRFSGAPLMNCETGDATCWWRLTASNSTYTVLY